MKSTDLLIQGIHSISKISEYSCLRKILSQFSPSSSANQVENPDRGNCKASLQLDHFHSFDIWQNYSDSLHFLEVIQNKLNINKSGSFYQV